MMRGEKDGLSPMQRVLFCLGMMVTAVCSAHPFLGAELSVVMLLWARVYGKVPVGKYLRMFRLPLGFLALSGLVLLWEYSGVRERILSFSVGPGYLSMTRETVLRTILVTFRALGAVSALFALGMTTPVTELTGVLKRLHCPDLICSLMYLMYRYIFLMYQVHGNMKQAAEGRMGYMDYRTSLRTTAGIYGNLLAYSYRQAGANFDAMESRCFDGSVQFLSGKYRKDWRKTVILVILVLLEIGICICWRSWPAV